VLTSPALSRKGATSVWHWAVPGSATLHSNRPFPSKASTDLPLHTYTCAQVAEVSLCSVFLTLFSREPFSILGRLLQAPRTVPDEGFYQRCLRNIFLSGPFGERVPTSAKNLNEPGTTSTLTLWLRSFWPCYCNSIVGGNKPSRIRSAPTFAHVPPGCLLSYASIRRAAPRPCVLELARFLLLSLHFLVQVCLITVQKRFAWS
jgi:hypothetical protein